MVVLGHRGPVEWICFSRHTKPMRSFLPPSPLLSYRRTSVTPPHPRRIDRRLTLRCSPPPLPSLPFFPGYSETGTAGYVTTEAEMADDLFAALAAFYAQPGNEALAACPFFLMGESYAGFVARSWPCL